MSDHTSGLLSKHAYILNILLPLLAGLSVYVLLRPDSYVSLLLSGPLHITYTNTPSDMPSGILRLLNNFGPDICWSYSLVFAVHAAAEDLRHSLLFTISLSVVVIILVESLQGFGILSGVFDPLDLVLEIAAAITATLILVFVSRKNRRNTHEKENPDSAKSHSCHSVIHRNGRRKRIIG